MSKGQNRQMGGLPSLRALYIFEAASRHLTLIRAAEALGLTQGALSRQIRSLEDHFGFPLFIRKVSVA
jgi:DNA-binding transcriptional LysR family regulator